MQQKEQQLIYNLSDTFVPILKTKVQCEDYISLDLSTGNEALENYDMSSDQAIQQYIDLIYQSTGKKIAFGGYLEKRNIYQRSSYFKVENPELERNVHLGIDIWAPSETAVIAPIDGELHSFKNNTNFGDYGPTIILKHVKPNLTFYSLYGHLSLASLKDKTVGQSINKGEVIGRLGTPEVNGNYAPHIHFQLILNIEEYKGDYPGVCNKKDLEFYLQNCPDPNLLLKIT